MSLADVASARASASPGNRWRRRGHDVACRERLQHGPERIVQREHVDGAAAGRQRQHGLVLQRGLREQVQKNLEHAAAGRLVDRRGDQMAGARATWSMAAAWRGARRPPAAATASKVANVQPLDGGAAQQPPWLTESSSAAERERQTASPISRMDMESTSCADSVFLLRMSDGLWRFPIRRDMDCGTAGPGLDGVAMTARFLLARVDLVEAATVGEVFLVRFGPAAEPLLDGEQVQLGKLLGVFGLGLL